MSEERFLDLHRELIVEFKAEIRQYLKRTGSSYHSLNMEVHYLYVRLGCSGNQIIPDVTAQGETGEKL